MKNNIKKSLFKKKIETGIVINTNEMELKLDGKNVANISIEYAQLLPGSKFKYLVVYNLRDGSKWFMDEQLCKRN